MTTLTIQLEEALLEKTQAIAKATDASLDEYVAGVLKSAVEQPRMSADKDSPEERGRRWDAFMADFGKYDTGGPYTRDEMNER